MFTSILFCFSLAHYVLPWEHHVRELIGDIFLAGNVIKIFAQYPNLLRDKHVLCIQREDRFPALDFHILMEMAWYMASLPYTRDPLMILHHVVTASVMAIAYYYNVTYITFMVLASIIWSNILLGLSKMARKNNWVIKTPIFVMFTISFFVFRILLLPFYVMPMLVFDVRDYWVIERNIGHVYWLVVSSMGIIISMQFYWMAKILRLLIVNIV